ncbi:hypothetical protein [Streptomyces akebiae]|uniref:Uncharacterized protein n=1 Tax=Streptomyces akebiae TaxID=2865673 RepID=A0ABX8XL26_9ACTN|nr:hypothetical protein [Streptomyces akebiae]QYX76556.1 hypothetical protein K1J60_08615 [Streptomyces akebiae]
MVERSAEIRRWRPCVVLLGSAETQGSLRAVAAGPGDLIQIHTIVPPVVG